MRLLRCTYDRHAGQILAIFNEAILNSTALYDYRERTPEMMVSWFAMKEKGNFPVLGLENDAGELAGFTSFGTFRAFPAYKYTVEHSLYVEKRFRGQGLGRRLLAEIIESVKTQNYHVMVAGIDSGNSASIRLHQGFGFAHSGTIREAGFKFGRWLDLAFYQLKLPTPDHPMDG